MELTRRIYAASARFPGDERFGLTSQMRRAVVSIPSNVAEGWCRKHRREYAQGVNVATGSSGELQTLIEVSKDLVYVSEAEFKDLDAKIEHLRAMLLTLYGKLT